jgi:hypothetical protein
LPTLTVGKIGYSAAIVADRQIGYSAAIVADREIGYSAAIVAAIVAAILHLYRK